MFISYVCDVLKKKSFYFSTLYFESVKNLINVNVFD